MITINYYGAEAISTIKAGLMGQEMHGLNAPVSKVMIGHNNSIELHGSCDSDVIHLRVGEQVVIPDGNEKAYITHI
jgi:hypothetical protein